MKHDYKNQTLQLLRFFKQINAFRKLELIRLIKIFVLKNKEKITSDFGISFPLKRL